MQNALANRPAFFHHAFRPQRRAASRVGCVAFLLTLICGSWGAHAVEIEETRWGFNGNVVLHRFNVLSVLVRNPANEPFEGTLRLEQGYPGMPRVGAVLEEPLYLSPGAARWVQFYPYMTDNFETWTLRWGRGDRNTFRFDDQIPVGEPIPVLLIDEAALVDRGGGLPRFPDQLFPPTVTATDTLHTVILDHAPRWEQARRTAFRDWIARGGTLHLLQGPDGQFPHFTAELSELNTPLDTFRIGSGLVKRHARTRSTLDRDFLAEIGFVTTRTAADPVPANANVQSAVDPYGSNDYLFTDLPTGLFNQLKLMTRASHNWLVIYGMSIVYMLLIFPGCFLLGRKRTDYRIVYGIILATVALFSLGFSVVGRRGYGEATAVHSIAFAHHLEGDEFDVTGWVNVFVTDGDDYTLDFSGSGPLYSACQHVEAVDGVIHNGPGGHFLVDIPPYSSRPFGYRVKATIPGWTFTPVEFRAGETLEAFTAECNRDLTELDSSAIYGLYRNQIYRLNRDGRRLSLAPHSEVALGSFLNAIDSNAFTQYSYYYTQFDDGVTPEARFATLHKPLLAASLGLNRRDAAAQFSLPDDHLRLFIFDRIPESLRLRDPRFSRQLGYILYSIDVFPLDHP